MLFLKKKQERKALYRFQTKNLDREKNRLAYPYRIRKQELSLTASTRRSQGERTSFYLWLLYVVILSGLLSTLHQQRVAYHPHRIRGTSGYLWCTTALRRYRCTNGDGNICGRRHLSCTPMSSRSKYSFFGRIMSRDGSVSKSKYAPSRSSDACCCIWTLSGASPTLSYSRDLSSTCTQSRNHYVWAGKYRCRHIYYGQKEKITTRTSSCRKII